MISPAMNKPIAPSMPNKSVQSKRSPAGKNIQFTPMTYSSPEKNRSFKTKNPRYKAAEQAVVKIDVSENMLLFIFLVAGCWCLFALSFQIMTLNQMTWFLDY